MFVLAVSFSFSPLFFSLLVQLSIFRLCFRQPKKKKVVSLGAGPSTAREESDDSDNEFNPADYEAIVSCLGMMLAIYVALIE
jgi:hypothetical protein